MDGEVFRILLVEDNMGDILLFRKALQSAEFNFELSVIEDGADALNFVQSEGKYAHRGVPDLVVLDLNLPKVDGVEVLAAIRSTEDLSDVLVVIVTSSASPCDRGKVEQLGNDRYIQKPLGLQEFLNIGLEIREVLLGRDRKFRARQG